MVPFLHWDFQGVSSLENIDGQASWELNSKMTFVEKNLGRCYKDVGLHH